jgi:CRISPR-associated exonuclease Cas4
MISALEHVSYCPRQFALIHIEQVFDENVFTLRGRAVHERVDSGEASLNDGVRVERALPLWSNRLGLTGKSDVVEFHGDVPYPVEYKHGAKREKEHDDLQLCAQALCLEEMMGVPVPRGAIFYHGSRRRREVEFSPELKARVEDAIQSIRRIMASGKLPAPLNDKRCKNCSLMEACLPSAVAERERLKNLGKSLFAVDVEG